MRYTRAESFRYARLPRTLVLPAAAVSLTPRWRRARHAECAPLIAAAPFLFR